MRQVPDAALTAAQLADVSELAEIAATAVRDGRKVLVRCHSGFNRSGLVVVQALGQLRVDVPSPVTRLPAAGMYACSIEAKQSSWRSHTWVAGRCEQVSDWLFPLI